MLRKTLKYVGFLLIILIILLSAIVAYFNTRYNKALDKIEKEQTTLVDQEVDFFKFRLELPEDQPAILPVPKKFDWTNQNFEWPKKWILDYGNSDIKDLLSFLKRLQPLEVIIDRSAPNLLLNKDLSIEQEAYKLDISNGIVTITYSAPQGLYYAVTTLSQLYTLYPNTMSGLVIEDEPDMEIRGVMLDISRDKVPQLKTLYEIVDMLALMKINHLQLYVEGFSFGYPSFKKQWEGKETPITPSEIRLLDQYCRDRFIELAANQNSLGHMEPWLKTEEYKDLAECPDGYSPMPLLKMKATLDPQNPRSIELVTQMMDDMMPHFSSNIFNANLDEPFELGKCKNEALADEIGIDRIYLDFVKKVHRHCTSNDKKMWMWGDIVNKHPEIISDLPEDITLLEWGYEYDHPFDENTKRIKEAGLDFLVCPGTSSWMSITGRTDNMFGNISNAAHSGMNNGAKGLLLTDWGDMGHWQYLPVSFAGMAYAASVSWNVSSDRNLPLQEYLNTFLFKDSKGELADIALDMGRYNHFESIAPPNATNIFLAYQFGLTDQVLHEAGIGAMRGMIEEIAGSEMSQMVDKRFEHKKNFEFENLTEYLDNISTRISQPEMKVSEVNVYRDEMRNGIEMVKLGAAVKNYAAQKSKWTSVEKIEVLQAMKKQVVDIQEEHKRLWLLRNKSGGLERSLKSFRKLEASIDSQLEVAKSSDLMKSLDRLKDKVIAGGAAWYLQD